MQRWLKQQQSLLDQMNRRLYDRNARAYKSTGFFLPYFFSPKGSESHNNSENRVHVSVFPDKTTGVDVKDSAIAAKNMVQQTDGKKKPKAVYHMSAYDAPSLSEEDLNKIIGLYGNRIENIYELNAGQQWMLETSKRVHSAFFLQILTKAVIPLDPAAFRQRTDEVCEKYESLRSAFVYRGFKGSSG